MRVSIIAAYAVNRVIGRGNQIPWKLPADLRRFKRLTMGHHLIVGRKTFESIGRPLPGRKMIVLTRNADYAAQGIQPARSVEEALRMAEKAGDDEAFIGGGEQIYRLTIDRAHRLYLTLLDDEFEGDAYFPRFDWDQWKVAFEEKHRQPFAYRFLDLERRTQGESTQGAKAHQQRTS